MPIDTRSPEYRGALNCVRSNSILGIVAQRVDELETELAYYLAAQVRLGQRNAELLKALDELIDIADDPDARGDIPEQDEILDRAKAAAAAARGRES